MSGLALSSRSRIALLVSGAFLFALAWFATASSVAEAASRPCWETLIDDWVLDGRIDGVYSERCREAARNHLPEDLRAYSNFDDELDAARQESVRTPQGSGGSGGSNLSRDEAAKETRDLGKTADGPIPKALNAGGSTKADSIPLPLIVLSALALLLMSAGAAGFAYRKLRARNPGSG